MLLPGSPATYANRAFLKGLGLRWDPERHRWHGTASAENVRALRAQLGLEVRCFGTLFQAPETEVAPKGPTAPKPATPPIAPCPAIRPRLHDSSRTRFESRLAFGGAGEEQDAEEIATPTRQFSIWDTTSGLPDDSREEDERRVARHLRDLRGRVKAARAVVSTTPGLADTLAGDWTQAARFYARFGITETAFRCGVPQSDLRCSLD